MNLSKDDILKFDYRIRIIPDGSDHQIASKRITDEEFMAYVDESLKK